MAITFNADTTNGAVITSDTSGEIELQANGVTKAKVTTNGLQDANGNSLRGGMYRNLIINGDMRIDQRNAGASKTFNASGADNGYALDRYYITNNTDGTATVQQVSDAPSSFSHSLKYTITASDASLGATQQGLVRQNIEANNITQLDYGTANAKTITISFWVKSSVTGTYSVSINNSTYTYGYIKEYTILSANTWEKKSITISGATAGTWNTTGNIHGLALHFGLGTGSDFIGTPNSWFSGFAYGTSSTTNLFATNGATWQITGVQLEVGEGASDFEFLPYDVQLQRCQRYYFQYAGDTAYRFSTGYVQATTLSWHVVYHTVTMRSGPTVSYANFEVRDPTARAISSLVVNQIGPNEIYILATITGGVAGNGCQFRAYADGAYMKFDAEL